MRDMGLVMVTACLSVLISCYSEWCLNILMIMDHLLRCRILVSRFFILFLGTLQKDCGGIDETKKP